MECFQFKLNLFQQAFPSANLCSAILLYAIVFGIPAESENLLRHDRDTLLTLTTAATGNKDSAVFTDSGDDLAADAGVTLVDGVCANGDPPWNRTWLLSQVKPFLRVFDRRPRDNILGTPLMHQFALWCVVRSLRPRHVVESGVLHGLGTWLLRQAAPQAQLILLDPTVNLQLAYEDRHNDTRYFTGHNFRDFSTLQHWSDVDIDFTRTLAFIDDHHTPLLRVAHARRVGIRHMIFEDNYWLGFYDCFSLKQACACVMGWRECARFKYKDAYGAQKRDLRYDDVIDSAAMFKNLSVYNEVPMLWDVWSPGVTMVSRQSRNYLIAEKNGSKVLHNFGLKNLPPESHMNGKYTYANIAYVRLTY